MKLFDQIPARIVYVLALGLVLASNLFAYGQSYVISQTLSTTIPSGLPAGVTGGAGQQTNIIAWNGNSSSCSANISFATASGTYYYQSFTFPNTSTSNLCVSVSLGNNGGFFSSLYLNSFDSSNIATNWQGNAGLPSGNNPLSSFSTTVPGLTNFVIVITSLGYLIGEPYQFTVSANPIMSCPPLSITTQPTADTVAYGQWGTFSVIATGLGLNYVWNNNATTPTMTTSTSGTAYNVLVSDACGNFLESQSAFLTLTCFPTLSITSQPVSQTAPLGETVTLSVAATGLGLSYIGVNSTSDYFALDNLVSTTNFITVTSSGKYLFRIQDACNRSLLTDVATVKIICPQPLTITSPLLSQSITYNHFPTLSLAALGTGLKYQWFPAYGTPATTSILATLQGSYFVLVTDACGDSLWSDTALVNISCQTLTITSQPVSQLINNGATATLSVTALGDDLKYVWNHINDTSQVVTVSHPGYYQVTITDFCQRTITSNYAVVTVTCPPQTLTITSQPKSQHIAAIGDTTIISIGALGQQLTYYWNVNNSFSNIHSTSLIATDTGRYYVIITDSCYNNLVSDTAYVTIGTPSLGIQNLSIDNSNQIQIFPNPADESVTIISKEFEKLEIYAINGILVKTIPSPSPTLNLDISDFPPGVYNFSLYKNQLVLHQKVVIF
jgi:hypothetical protein